MAFKPLMYSESLSLLRLSLIMSLRAWMFNLFIIVPGISLKGTVCQNLAGRGGLYDNNCKTSVFFTGIFWTGSSLTAVVGPLKAIQPQKIDQIAGKPISCLLHEPAIWKLPLCFVLFLSQISRQSGMRESAEKNTRAQLPFIFFYLVNLLCTILKSNFASIWFARKLGRTYTCPANTQFPPKQMQMHSGPWRWEGGMVPQHSGTGSPLNGPASHQNSPLLTPSTPSIPDQPRIPDQPSTSKIRPREKQINEAGKKLDKG